MKPNREVEVTFILSSRNIFEDKICIPRSGNRFRAPDVDGKVSQERDNAIDTDILMEAPINSYQSLSAILPSLN
jgi:hypothetical protein